MPTGHQEEAPQNDCPLVEQVGEVAMAADQGEGEKRLENYSISTTEFRASFL